MVVASIKATETRAGAVIIRIGLSDGALFSLNPVYLPRAFQGEAYFSPGKEVSSEEAAALHFAADCFRAERAGLRLVARAEQTRLGISRKLEHRGHGAPCIKAAVSYLEKLKILDDLRFAERWIQSRLYRGTDSPLRLINSLCQRGIDRDTARRACKATLDLEKETELLKKFIAKRYPGEGQDTRFLKARLKIEGFSAEAREWYWEER
jgi:regulatory protein